MNLTDRILIEGIAAIIEALGMIAQNQTCMPHAQWGTEWFNEAAGIFRNKVTDMVIEEAKKE
jgi:hypothetical protein